MQKCARRYNATRLGSVSAAFVVVDRRRQARHAVPVVDLVHLAIDRRFNRAVAVETRSRRHADLEKREPPAQLGTAGEHAIERLEPFGNPLGVVEPIDAQSEQAGLETECLPEPLLLIRQRRIAARRV